MKKPRIVIVAAIGNGRQFNGGLGKDGKLLWHIPDDLKRFKKLTTGHPVIMGRKTFDSILKQLGEPLPGRSNIVVSREMKGTIYKEVILAHSLEEALEKARELDSEEIHIGGGAQLYEQALPLVDKLCLTLIDDEKEADTFFPPYEHLFKKMTYHEHRDHNGLTYQWVDLEK